MTIAKLRRTVRRWLFHPAPWRVCEGNQLGRGVWWAESKGAAGHFRSNVMFRSEETAQFWCDASNLRSSWRWYVGIRPVMTPGGHWAWGCWVPAHQDPGGGDSAPGDPG